MKYKDFIAKKRRRVQQYGFEATVLNPSLKDWQAHIVRWAVRRGRAAIFANTGLGKTLAQLSWAENIVANVGPVLLVCPLGVRLQTRDEAKKFGIGCDVRLVNSQTECGPGINITNYDKLDKFDGSHFAGVVIDESSILKGIASKTKAMLCDMFANTRYRLACTATPSPNDHTELGNHAEFLGVMRGVDMQTRFFYHDSGDTSRWVLMPHAEKDFWHWTASWAVCIDMPSDIGGDDTDYILPALNIHRHHVEVPELALTDGMLFNTGRTISATNIHEEKRLSAACRVAKAVEIVASDPQRKTLIWCDSNKEQDMLEAGLAAIGVQCASIRGSTPGDKKESLEQDWRLGDVPVLISKGSIFGMGMNWQHCCKMIFVGLTFSFESYFQSIRRCWRFGQPNEVDVHIIIAETETAMQSSLARKENDHAAMRSGMAEAMRERTLEEFGLDHSDVAYEPQKQIQLPEWISGLEPSNC